MTEELSPCVCGCDRPHLNDDCIYIDGWHVNCPICDINGTTDKDKQKAIGNWNSSMEHIRYLARKYD